MNSRLKSRFLYLAVDGRDRPYVDAGRKQVNSLLLNYKFHINPPLLNLYEGSIGFERKRFDVFPGRIKRLKGRHHHDAVCEDDHLHVDL